MMIIIIASQNNNETSSVKKKIGAEIRNTDLVNMDGWMDGYKWIKDVDNDKI